MIFSFLVLKIQCPDELEDKLVLILNLVFWGKKKSVFRNDRHEFLFITRYFYLINHQ